MKKGRKQKRTIAGAVALAMLLSGCGNAQVQQTKTTAVSTKEEASGEAAEDFFPDSYQRETEKIKFDCELEVSEEFQASEFHIPIVKGFYNYDQDAARDIFVDMERVTEQYEYPPTEQMPVTEHIYIYEDGTGIYLSMAMNYYHALAPKYHRVTRESEKGASRENFSFAEGDACVAKVRETLKEIGYPEDEFAFDWFSISGEEYAQMEQEALAEGTLEQGYENQEGWTEADNSYEIYGWQMYEGLPVFPWVMTTLMKRSVENYQKAPVSALFTEAGMLTLMAQDAYILEKTEEKAVFKAFSEIADALVMKYENLLDEKTYSVTRAKLVLRTYYDDQQELAAEPVWYFEIVDSTGNMEIVLIHAVTGQEIYLA